MLGGGGHCKSVIDAIEQRGLYRIWGIVDVREKIGENLLGYEIKACDEDLEQLFARGLRLAAITVGSIGDVSVRKKLYRAAATVGFNFPPVIDVSSRIASSVLIEEGVFVGKNCVINADARVGSFAIVNTGAIIEHDCKVGDFSHIAPGAVLSGNVIVSANAHIGAGSVVIQGITVGVNALIGAGSVVVKDVPSDVKAFGSPCRTVGDNKS